MPMKHTSESIAKMLRTRRANKAKMKADKEPLIKMGPEEVITNASTKHRRVRKAKEAEQFAMFVAAMWKIWKS